MRYYFDVETSARFVRDETGSEHENQDSAKRVALASLQLIASDGLPNADSFEAKIFVRDESDQRVLTTTIAISASWANGCRSIQ